ncbi:restriction endonuclease subunit S [Desulfobacterales bacterium HSG2]|nr:restriction endonuclease subunit S [Desulfobacterales bacterium HSG2]
MNSNRYKKTLFGFIPNDWKLVKLSKICNNDGGIQTGPFGSQLHQEDYVDNGTPIITVEHLGDNEIIHKNLPGVSDEDKKRLKKFILETGDIVFSRVGSVDRSSIVRENENGWLFSGRCLRVRGNKETIDPYYLSHFFGLQTFKSYVRNNAVGATMPSLNTSIMSNLLIILPPILIQQKIASVLSAYDDLIENNNRRIAILEQMAQSIYKEWFVRMRFPGYQNAEFADGLPKGWIKQKVGDTFEITGGGTPSKEKNEYWKNGDIDWYTPTDITSNGLFLTSSKLKINDLGLARSSAKLFPPYSIMMTSRATIGEIGINTKEACTNQGFITCLPNERISYLYIYFWIKYHKKLIILLSSGATFAEMTKSVFKKMDILVPSQEATDEFFNITDPMFKQIEALIKKNINLKKTRDLLLPRLITAKLSVDNINPESEES